MKIFTALLIAFSSVNGLAYADGPTCGPGSDDRRWMSAMVDMWTRVAAEDLDATPAIPWIVFFNGRCVHHLNPDMRAVHGIAGESAIESRVSSVQGEFPLVSAMHEGEVVLPDGERIGTQVTSFASAREEDGRAYFVMAMPEVWRAIPRHATRPDLDLLVAAVLAHEMTHTLHDRAFSDRLGVFEREHPALELDDDIVQQTFESHERISSMSSQIRERLYDAALARDDAQATELAAGAVRLMRERKELMNSINPAVASIEDQFLLMEGIGNWAGMRAIIREGIDREKAITTMRGSAKRWSQDEGLAVMLVLDRFADGWQSKVLADPTLSVVQLVESALADRRR